MGVSVSLKKTKVKLTKTATADKVEATKPAVKPDDAAILSRRQWFVPGVRIATAFVCKPRIKLNVFKQRQRGGET